MEAKLPSIAQLLGKYNFPCIIFVFLYKTLPDQYHTEIVTGIKNDR
jgi:hypothetical protein